MADGDGTLMLAIPALDLREGDCVQLVGGSYAAEAVRLADPVAVALEWKRAGFQHLHVVDLDAATGRGANQPLIERVLRESGMRCQVGGGIRTEGAIERLLSLGAEHVVLGTRALEEPVWLAGMAAAYPGRVIVAADAAQRMILTRGWQRTTTLSVIDAVSRVADLPLAAVLVTAVHREGRMTGPDLDLMRDVVLASDLPVQASGGITSLADLAALEQLGVRSAVLGMALYTRALDARITALEFPS